MFCPFFVNDTARDNVCKGGAFLGEEVVQTTPEEVPTAVLDPHIDLNAIRIFLMRMDGW